LAWNRCILTVPVILQEDEQVLPNKVIESKRFSGVALKFIGSADHFGRFWKIQVRLQRLNNFSAGGF
jgi:hypothetical protein